MSSEHSSERCAALPEGTSVYESGQWMPCCDVCGWVGAGHWHKPDAERACRAHARGRQHLEETQGTRS